MLHMETVSQDTLDLIKELCADEQLKDFVLVGGTALALQIGHRISVDIDLFSPTFFKSEEVAKYLQRTYNADITHTSQGSVNCFINDVKVDLVAHQYGQVNDTLNTDGIRMATLEEIAAMKINAIVGNGSRLKDFVDIYTLLEYIPLKEMIKGYLQKYPETDYQMAISSMTYFKDITTKIDRINFIGERPTMEQLQKRIISASKEETRIFHISQEQKKSLANQISKEAQSNELKRQQKQLRRPKI